MSKVNLFSPLVSQVEAPGADILILSLSAAEAAALLARCQAVEKCAQRETLLEGQIERTGHGHYVLTTRFPIGTRYGQVAPNFNVETESLNIFHPETLIPHTTMFVDEHYAHVYANGIRWTGTIRQSGAWVRSRLFPVTLFAKLAEGESVLSSDGYPHVITGHINGKVITGRYEGVD